IHSPAAPVVSPRNSARGAASPYHSPYFMSVPSSAPGEAPAHEVKTLVCKRDMANALLCYESLFAAVGPKLKLVIHEDGTLDESDFSALRQHFPSATLIRRTDREPEVLETLARYPHCRAYRSQHPLSNKLLD